MILLASGGIDSYIAWHYLDQPQILFVNYGQTYYNIERMAIDKLYPRTSVNHVEVRGLPPLDKDNIHIPVRNLMLASLALRYSNLIALGGVKDEQCSDKSPLAFKQISAIFSKQHHGEVTVYSPIWHFTKSEAVADFIKTKDSNLLRNTISCYSDTLCNDCESCFRRFVALAVNGIIEPDRLPKTNIIRHFINNLTSQPYNRAVEIIVALNNIGYIISYDDRYVKLTNRQGETYFGKIKVEDIINLKSLALKA